MSVSLVEETGVPRGNHRPTGIMPSPITGPGLQQCEAQGAKEVKRGSFRFFL